MKLPLQIAIRNIPHSEAIEANIREKAEKLDRFHERIMSCRTVVETTQRRHHQGKLFSVRIDITVPGKEMAVTREENEDVYVAIRDAFDAAVRRLEEHARKQRGDVKAHVEPSSGRVARVFKEQNYGFIETADEREIYFHRNCVLNSDFEKIRGVFS